MTFVNFGRIPPNFPIGKRMKLQGITNNPGNLNPKKFKLLLANPMAKIRKRFANIFSKVFGNQIKIVEAEDGFKFLKAMEGKEKFDLIIGSLIMSGPGVEFALEKIREMGHRVRVWVIPNIFITSSKEEGWIERIKVLGGEFISTEASDESLKKVVQAVFDSWSEKGEIAPLSKEVSIEPKRLSKEEEEELAEGLIGELTEGGTNMALWRLGLDPEIFKINDIDAIIRNLEKARTEVKLSFGKVDENIPDPKSLAECFTPRASKLLEIIDELLIKYYKEKGVEVNKEIDEEFKKLREMNELIDQANKVKDNYTQETELLERALKIYPEYMALNYRLGALYYSSKIWNFPWQDRNRFVQRAIFLLKKVIETDPDALDAYHKLHLAHLHFREYEEAFKVCVNWIGPWLKKFKDADIPFFYLAETAQYIPLERVISTLQEFGAPNKFIMKAKELAQKKGMG